jgi:type III secretion protein L
MSSTAIRSRRRIIPADEAKAWMTGYEFLAAAKNDAAALRRQSAEIFEAERQRGIEAGRREGAAAKAQLLAEATTRIDRAFAAAEPAIVATVLATVEKLLGSFDQQELLVRLARHAMSQLRDAKHLILRVAASEASAMAQRLAVELGSGAALVEIVGDPILAPQEAVLESEFGFVALGVEAQLAALRRGLGANKAGEVA